MIYTKVEAKQELAYEIDKGYATIEQLRDRIGEYVDSAMPIYYSDVISEWQFMPSEYMNRGVDELGAGDNPTVISLMLLDLYLHYYDLYTTALDELEQLAEAEVSNA